MAVSLPYPIPDPATGEYSAFATKQNFEFLARLLTSIQTGQLMPSGGIIFMRSGTTCPAGFNAVATYNGRFLRFGATGGTTGTESVTVSVPTSTTNVTAGAVAVASSTHLHTLSNITPAYVDLLMCQKT